jgi:hypothetical protein
VSQWPTNGAGQSPYTRSSLTTNEKREIEQKNKRQLISNKLSSYKPTDYAQTRNHNMYSEQKKGHNVMWMKRRRKLHVHLYSALSHCWYIEVFDVDNIIIISSILNIHVFLFIAYHNVTFDDDERVDR